MIKLAILSLQFMAFTTDKKYYNQKQGSFIGVPTSPGFAEIYIHRLYKSVYPFFIKSTTVCKVINI